MTGELDPLSRAWLESLGESMRESRLKSGKSQQDLADDSGLHRTYINEIEHGRRNPTAVSLRKLCLALGLSVSRIILRAEEIMRDAR